MNDLTERLDALEPIKALQLVEREFPSWRTWTAGGICHASPRSGPVLLVHGEDAVDLRDQIIRAESLREGQ